MNTPKFTTVQSRLGDRVVNRGIIQVERIIGSPEFFRRLNAKTSYAAASGKAVVNALAVVLTGNADRAMSTTVDGFAKFLNTCRGSFESNRGPWVKGVNRLEIQARVLDPFKSVFDGITPVNRTEGARPRITTVKVDGLEYDEIKANCTVGITGTDLMVDTDAADEYVELINRDGEVLDTIVPTVNTLGYIEGEVGDMAAEDGDEITLRVYTRSGMGSDYGVNVATRKLRFRA